MKIHTIIQCVLAIFVFELASCIPAKQKNSITKETFTSDYLYKTKEDKERFQKLKKKFLESWSDTSNCYRGTGKLPKMWWKFYQDYTKQLEVDNILSTPKGDTLMVLVTGYAVRVNEDSSITQRTYSIGMGVVIDSSGEWQFKCEGGSSWLVSEYENQEKQKLQLRELVLKYGYLDEKGNPSPVFWKKLYRMELW